MFSHNPIRFWRFAKKKESGSCTDPLWFLVFGMGVDLATILAIMGTVGVGNPLSLNPGFSIGGESSKSSNVLDNLLGLLGTFRIF